MSQRPQLSQDPDGVLRAVWYDSRSADWRWEVFTSRLDPSTGWTVPTQLATAGNNTWPAADQGVVVFTSDRAAERIQRDHTQQIYRLQAYQQHWQKPSDRPSVATDRGPVACHRIRVFKPCTRGLSQRLLSMPE